MIDAARGWWRRLAEQRAVRSIADRLYSSQYRTGAPWGFADRSVARLVALDPTPPDVRARSVVDLVDLFFDLVRAAAVSRFIEAGAKDAAASIRAVGMPTIDTVVAFEANPYTHRRFAARLAEHGVRYEHRALTERTEAVVFHVRRDVDSRPMADGQGSILEQRDHEPGLEQVTVDGARLDDALSGDPTARSAIWIDVEGAVDQVMRGAVGTLELTDVVMVEVERRPKWEGQAWLDGDVVRFMLDAGLVPVARDRQSRHQYNIVFVRRRLLDDPAVAPVLEARRPA